MEDLRAQLSNLLGGMDAATLQYMFGQELFREARAEGNDEKHDKAIKLLESSLEKTPESDPAFGERSCNLGIMRLRQHDRTGSTEEFDLAIKSLQDAVTKTPLESPDRVRYYEVLANELRILFDETGEFKYLDNLINTEAENTPERVAWLDNFGHQLRQRYELRGQFFDLQAAIRIGEYAVNAASEESDRIMCLNTLSVALNKRYQGTNNREDLTRATCLAREAVGLATEKNKYRAASLCNLSIYQRVEYESTGEMEPLLNAVACSKECLEFVGNGPDAIHCFIALGSALERRFDELGDVDDLAEALKHMRTALELASIEQSPSDYPSLLNNLSGLLGTMYLRTGDITLLTESITYGRKSCESTPGKHIDRPLCLDSLSAKLSLQFQRTGESEILEEAIETSRASLQASEAKSIHRAGRMNNLATRLQLRYVRNPNIKDLDEAIQVARGAIKLIPEEHPHTALLTNNLANSLQYKYRFTGNPLFLDQGIAILRKVAEKVPEHSPGLSSKLHNLAIKLDQRYALNRKPKDIDDAVEILERVLDKMPPENQVYPTSAKALGHGYQTQFSIRPDQPALLDRALDYFLQASESPQALPLLKVRAVRQAIAILHRRKEWHRADELAQKALSLLPLVCGRYMGREDQVHAMIQVAGLAADAGSLALRTDNIERAIQQLEFGRGLILGYLIDSRSEISELKKDLPELAQQYEALRFAANRQVDSKSKASREHVFAEKRDAAQNLESVLKKIRDDPRYRTFLEAPSMLELKNAAEAPIVVINVTDISSDAIIVTKTCIKAIPLPGLISGAAPILLQQHLKRYTLSRADDDRDTEGEDALAASGKATPEHLAWLWSNGVKLVLEELEAMDAFGSVALPPKVCWVGCGVAASFPFHAARSNTGDPTEDAMARVVSSYSPTIKSLSHSQSRAKKMSETGAEKPSILVITMPTTPDHKPLEGAKMESEKIRQVCDQIYSFNSLESPTAEKVLDALSESTVIHFACHGESDFVNPLESRLLLQKQEDGKPVVDGLSVSRLAQVAATGRARMVFLSACSTAVVQHGKLGDEGIHLTNAFQAAGFTHVIGSMWTANDGVCVKLAEAFYRYLLDGGRSANFSDDRVARALRSAILDIRSQYADEPSMWAPFVHFGA